ncbi:hypothetical protein MHYP_G00047970 [Metynnis hypsauchen]
MVKQCQFWPLEGAVSSLQLCLDGNGFVLQPSHSERSEWVMNVQEEAAQRAVHTLLDAVSSQSRSGK